MTPTDLTYVKLEAMTNNFSPAHEVGRGGFGKVYKGVLDDGTEIAIKKLNQNLMSLDNEQFKKEFNNLMKVRHENIIRLIAYCFDIQKKPFKDDKGEYQFASDAHRALCFEYFKRGSLDKHLSEESCGLDWNTRYKIIKGICRGLDYLHNGLESAMRMYHLDLKPGNILLDDSFMPKIADFGLSRLFVDSMTHITNTTTGTIAYLPPEFIQKRQISKKFDVFSLGILIIQIMAGPSGHSKCTEAPERFIEDVKENWKKRLQATSGCTLISQEADNLEIKTCIELALRSVEADREKRPTVREIVDKLKEIEIVRKSLTGQNSQCKLERLAIDPFEVRFPLKLGAKDVFCVLQLTNRSADFVAFTAQVDQSKYRTQPDSGVLPPLSKTYMCITMGRLQAQGNLPAECGDILIVKSARAINRDGSATVYDVVEGEEVEEARLPIVYVPLPLPPARLKAQGFFLEHAVAGISLSN